MSFEVLRQKIIEKRRMKDVKLETDYIQIGDLFDLLDLQEKQLHEIFDGINKNTHPIGTKSWLYEFENLKKRVLGVDSDKKESMK